jgi:23S rRNA (pseudouridine1915-N3)-methyltransferase
VKVKNTTDKKKKPQKNMHIRIFLIGKVRESYIREGISLYLRRLSVSYRINLIELPDDSKSGNIPCAKDEQKRGFEAIRLMERSGPAGTLFALDAGGELWTSEELASRLQKLELGGEGPLAFLIGGSRGLSPPVLARADLVLSLSPMTFPHQLVPLLLLEQIYRADCINRKIPYHK